MDTSRKKLQVKRRSKVPDVPLTSSNPQSNPFQPPESQQQQQSPKKNQTPFKFKPVGHFDVFPFQPPEQSQSKTNDNVPTVNISPQTRLVNIEEFNTLIQYGRSLEQNYVQL